MLWENESIQPFSLILLYLRVALLFQKYLLFSLCGSIKENVNKHWAFLPLDSRLLPAWPGGCYSMVESLATLSPV